MVNDQRKTKHQLIEELAELRVRIAETETVAARCRQAEEALRESEERLRLLHENTPLGYQSLDENGNLLTVNQAWLDILGYDRGEVIGTWFGDFLAPAYLEHFTQNFPRFKAAGRINNVEFRMVRKDGTQVDVSYDGRIDYDTLGNFKQTHCILHDITERRLAEDALKESERRLEDAQAQGKIGYWEFDVDNQSIVWSNETYRLYGRDPALGPPTVAEEASYYAEEQVATLRDYTNRAVRNGEAFEYDLEASLPGRGQVWFAASMRPIRDDDGRVARLFGTVQDITERKKAEEALRQYETIVSSSTDMMALLDDRFTYLAANEAYSMAFGLTPEQLIGRTVTEMVGRRFFAAVTKPAADRCMVGQDANHQAWFDYPRYGRRHMDINYYPHSREDGKIVGFVVNCRDITRRKLAEEALAESEAKYRSLVETSTDMIAVVDLNGRFTFVNDAWIEGMGYSREAVPEMHGFDYVHPDDAQHAQASFESLTLGNSVENDEIRFRTGSGEYIDTLTNLSPMLDAQGEVVAVLTASRDVTDRKRMAEQLQQSQLLASLGEMTAGIAHEVNNPLSAILLYSELISQLELSPAVKKDLKVIRSEAKRASNIMKNLLTYSRKAEPITRRMDIHRTLKKVVDMRRYEERVRNIDIAVKVADGPLRVHGNAAQLTQVFMNLIVNAEEALENSDDKRIVVTTEVDLNQARISIADSGIGIPEEHLTQVFVPFFSTKPTGRGTGLGLATCHGIVTAHGGVIRAENNDMGGATFIVELPLAKTKS